MSRERLPSHQPSSSAPPEKSSASQPAKSPLSLPAAHLAHSFKQLRVHPPPSSAPVQARSATQLPASSAAVPTAVPIQRLRTRQAFRRETTNFLGTRGWSDPELGRIDNLLDEHTQLMANAPAAGAAAAAHQHHSDERLRILHQIQQESHAWLHSKRGEHGNKYRAGVNNLLDDVQRDHRQQISEVHQHNLQLYLPGRATMSHAEQAAADNAWDAVRNQTGSIRYRDSPAEDPTHHEAGFGDEVRAMHARLLSNPAGRDLVTSVLARPQQVTVLPFHPDSLDGGNAGGAAAAALNEGHARAVEHPDHVQLGAGSGSAIRLEAGLRDSQLEEQADGDTIANPAHIVYGHELIHAMHNQRGHNLRNIGTGVGGHFAPGAPGRAQWTNAEEYETIERGAISENALRGHEHLTGRRSHH